MFSHSLIWSKLEFFFVFVFMDCQFFLAGIIWNLYGQIPVSLRTKAYFFFLQLNPSVIHHNVNVDHLMMHPAFHGIHAKDGQLTQCSKKLKEVLTFKGLEELRGFLFSFCLIFFTTMSLNSCCFQMLLKRWTNFSTKKNYPSFKIPWNKLLLRSNRIG